MLLNQTLSLMLNRTELVRLVDRIATESHEHVWERVRDRVVAMSPDQARGYIRVRSTQVIEHQLATAAAQAPALVNPHRAVIRDAVRGAVLKRTLVLVMRCQLERQRRHRRAA